MKTIVHLFLLIAFINLAKAGGEIRSLSFEPEASLELRQWDVVDINFTATESSEAPFEVDFTAVFKGPEDTMLKVPGFYNGDKTWVLRFSAPTAGQWSYETQSSLASLADKKGDIRVSLNDDPSRHGGLVLNPSNPQHFYYEDGTPCGVLAFEADWLFALDYANPDAAPKTENLLKHLQANGINQIVTTVYSYDVDWKKDPKLKQFPEYELGGRDEIYPFLGSNLKPDFSGLNIEFFQRFDRMVKLMDEYGITAHLMIYVWNKKVSWPAAETVEDNRYFDYIIKRYQAFPNVLWDVSKEALNNKRCSEEYGVERIHRIRKLDAYKRLVTVHDGGFCERNAKEVDFISWQNWHREVYTTMFPLRQRFPKHPIFNIEHGGYEKSHFEVFPGAYDDPAVCLRRNYQIMFAGVYSTYYWQGASWNVLIHDPFSRENFVKPRFDYYKHLTDFFTRFPYHTFQPSRAESYSAYGLTNGEGTYLVYLPKDHYQLSVYKRNGLGAKGGETEWFNVETGEYRKVTVEDLRYYISPWQGEADSILIRTFKNKANPEKP